MKQIWRGALCALALSMAPAGAAEDSVDSLRAGIENAHPATYYQLAAKLLTEQPDEAVFWFYAGQLRWRGHITCLGEAKAKDEMPLFGAMSETVGRPVNEYAFGDPPALAATLDKVLAWDDETANGFTSKTDCAAAFAEVREGLGKLRDKVIAEADEIRAARAKNGLPNR